MAKPLPMSVRPSAIQDDETLTDAGAAILTAYARAHLAGHRDLAIEKAYPELEGEFIDVRSDIDYAKQWAT